jgi:hypothetical protein
MVVVSTNDLFQNLGIDDVISEPIHRQPGHANLTSIHDLAGAEALTIDQFTAKHDFDLVKTGPLSSKLVVGFDVIADEEHIPDFNPDTGLFQAFSFDGGDQIFTVMLTATGEQVVISLRTEVMHNEQFAIQDDNGFGRDADVIHSSDKLCPTTE